MDPPPSNSIFLSRYSSKVTYVPPHLQAAPARNGVMPKWLQPCGRGEIRPFTSTPTVPATEPFAMPAERLNVDSFPVNKPRDLSIAWGANPALCAHSMQCGSLQPTGLKAIMAQPEQEGGYSPHTQGAPLECPVLVTRGDYTIGHLRISSTQRHCYKDQKM